MFCHICDDTALQIRNVGVRGKAEKSKASTIMEVTTNKNLNYSPNIFISASTLPLRDL